MTARQFRFADASVAYPPRFIEIRGFDCLENPSIIVEVLSDSTREYDEGDKLADWLRLPSVRHVLLIEQDRLLVREYTASGVLKHEGLAMEIALPAIDCVLTGAQIYRDVLVP